MKKILFVSKMNQITKELNNILTNMYQVQNSNYSADTIMDMIEVTCPDLVIISLIGADDLDTSVFSLIHLQHPLLPIVTIGDEIETKRIARYDEMDQLTKIMRPISSQQIVAAIDMILSDDNDISGQTVIKEPEPQVSTEHSHSAPAINLDIADGDSSKKTILVVDDNAGILRSIKSMLDEEYNVNVVTSGVKAVAMLGKKRPDLILLDYEMPVINGKQTLEMIRTEAEFQRIPVVFLTSVNAREQIQAVLSLNPNGYLLKPPVREKLLSTIKNIIG
ncbi:MAG: response regulator [Lachnospiraceae bacterium]|nr:response regulator [Lachnospiraceae bacterium]